MTCPKCGSQTVPDQKFCRSCGASLQLTTQRLTELTPVTDLESTSISFKDEEQRRGRLVLWGFIALFVGAAIGVVGKKLLYQDIVTVVGVLISLAGMFLTVYPYLSSPRRNKFVSGSDSAPESLTDSTPAKSLPQAGDLGTIPSVTERTTDLLHNPLPTKERKG